MLASFLKWILNPISIILIVLVLAIGTATFYKYKSDTTELNNTIDKQEEVLKAQGRNLDILEKDRPLIEALLNKKQTIILQEQKLQDEMNEIPDTSTNKPFTNSELLDAARILRDYQNARTSDNPTSTNN